MNNVKILLLSLAILPFFSEINANKIDDLDKHINELAGEWQELIKYCNTLPEMHTSVSYQEVTTNINERLSSLGNKTEQLTFNQRLQVYNLVETDPKTVRKPIDIQLSRTSCHSCANAMSIFNADKADGLILRELGAGDKTVAELREDENLKEELRKRRVRRTHINFKTH